jgi:nucleotide-binding universal stress UspA family protein
MQAKPVIAARDGSDASLQAVGWAAGDSVLRGEPLRIVSVPALPPRMSPDPDHRETVAGIVHRAAQLALVTAGQRVAELEPVLGGRAHTSGPRAGGASARADLVVLGRPAAEIAAGSVTHVVLGHAHGPVAIGPAGQDGADHEDDR